MGRTLTLEEIEDLSAYGLLREVVGGVGPLTVVLEKGRAVTLEVNPAEEPQEESGGLKLEPLPQFSVSIPEGWQDAIYDHT